MLEYSVIIEFLIRNEIYKNDQYSKDILYVISFFINNLTLFALIP